MQNRSQLDSVHRRAEQVRIELHAARRAFLLQAQTDGDRRDAMRDREERRLCRRQMHGELTILNSLQRDQREFVSVRARRVVLSVGDNRMNDESS